MRVEELFQSKKKEDPLIREFTKAHKRKEDPLIKYWMKRKKQKENEK